MNSNRELEIDESFCKNCNKLFYEFRDCGFSECPHCHAKLTDDNCWIDKTVLLTLEVDFKTGNVKGLNHIAKKDGD